MAKMKAGRRKQNHQNGSTRDQYVPPFDFFGAFFGRRVQNPEPQAVTIHPLETELLTEMLREGYKRCAMKYHPDHEGGDAEKMTELNRLKKELGL